MPIEKLEIKKGLHEVYCSDKRELTVKLNELIDFINTREQDRSEQMARLIDRVNKLDKNMNRVIDYSCAHENRLNSLEKATQPMEEKPEINECHTDACEVMGWSFMSDQNEWITMYKVDCICCGLRPGTLYKTKQEAITAWNSRK